MMILGISGSPNKDGNAEYLLGEALRVASEYGFRTEKILCSELKIGFCTDCGECGRGKPCPVDDHMAEVYEMLEAADGIIVASPVYFGNVTGQLKAVFDRTLLLRRQGFKLKNKVGCAIAVGRSRNGGQEKTIEAIQTWMHIQGMIVVGDNNHFGGIAVAPAQEDEIGLETVRGTASKLCDVLKQTK
ncbi:MAG: flavodoxin family protein [Methanotrichaceae archaeon]